MPYWEVFTPKNAYTDAEKKELAEAITQACVDFADLPRFFVNVRIQEMGDNEMFVGGEPTTNFVRIVTDTIARGLPTSEIRALCMAAIEEALIPFVKDRGFEWEVHLDETPIELWRVHGLIAPMEHPELIEQWKKENRPIPYELPVS